MRLTSEQLKALRLAIQALYDKDLFEEGLIIEELLDMYFSSL